MTIQGKGETDEQARPFTDDATIALPAALVGVATVGTLISTLRWLGGGPTGVELAGAIAELAREVIL